MNEEVKQKKSIGYLKFILFSIIGVIVFFVKVPYQEGTQVPIDIIITVCRAALAPVMNYIVLILALYSIVDMFIIRKSYKGSIINNLLAAGRVIGVAMVIMVVLKIGPAALLDKSIGPFTVMILGSFVALVAAVGAIFLPLLLEYGFANFIGVFLRPIMRPLFKVPGKVAIIAVTEYLGNFSLGLIASNKMYKNGEITGKEAAIVATGWGTCSLVTLMVFANMMGIMEYWGLYFLLTTVITCIITFITIRIYPLRKMKNEYYENVEIFEEQTYTNKLFLNAINEGVQRATKAPPLWKIELNQLKGLLPMIGSMVSIGMFFMAGGLLLKTYTPVVTWIGYLFWPFLALVQIPDIVPAMQSCGMSMLDAMFAVSINAPLAGELALTTRFLIAILPVSMIVFLSGFIPCFLGTEIPIKINKLLALWFIRVVLTILLVGIFGLIFF